MCCFFVTRRCVCVCVCVYACVFVRVCVCMCACGGTFSMIPILFKASTTPGYTLKFTNNRQDALTTSRRSQYCPIIFARPVKALVASTCGPLAIGEYFPDAAVVPLLFCPKTPRFDEVSLSEEFLSPLPSFNHNCDSTDIGEADGLVMVNKICVTAATVSCCAPPFSKDFSKILIPS